MIWTVTCVCVCSLMFADSRHARLVLSDELEAAADHMAEPRLKAIKQHAELNETINNQPQFASWELHQINPDIFISH